MQSALGLTTTEAENALALSVVETKGIDPKTITREKARTLTKNRLIEVVEAATSLDDIGGLAKLKEWLQRTAGAFSKSAKTYGRPAPKELLIVEIPGTGKSLTAKATAGAFGLPLLRLDMGRVFGGIVGQSESNLRSVIQTAKAIAPCVLWINEIEKGFSGSQSSGSTSSRVFGSFLSWMKEKTKAVFVVTGHHAKRSVTLGLYDGDKLVPADNVTIPPNHRTPEVGKVRETRYLYAYRESGGIYQPVYLGVLTDIPASECVVE